MSRCAGCGRTGIELAESRSAGGATVCLVCHLGAAPRGRESGHLELVGELRGEAAELLAIARERGDRELRLLAGRLDELPLLLEAGSDSETPAELVAAADELRAKVLARLREVAG